MLLQEVDSSDPDESFQHAPSISDALNEYQTNIDNMWSLRRFDRDLRVAIVELLRVAIPPERLAWFLAKWKQATKQREGNDSDKSSELEEPISAETIKNHRRSIIKKIDLALLTMQEDWVLRSYYEQLRSTLTTSIDVMDFDTRENNDL